MAEKHDCVDRLGLDEDDLPLLSGFTSRAFRALAHLREAWLVADAQNARTIETALIALMGGHSFAQNAEMVAKILRHGLPSDANLTLLANRLEKF